MNYIIFDMEFTVLRKHRYLADILEIGAIKLSDEDGPLRMVDLFHSHVRPSNQQKLTPLTTTFTGINQEQVDNAPAFNQVIHDWTQWLGTTPYYICSWGPDDKFQLIKHCNLNQLDLSWLQNYNDFQLQFTRHQNGDIGQRIGLRKALEIMGISFFGQQHNALDDAFNTAKLFSKIFPHLSFEENNAAQDQLHTSKLVYSTGTNINLPFSQLANLIAGTVL